MMSNFIVVKLLDDVVRKQNTSCFLITEKWRKYITLFELHKYYY